VFHRIQFANMEYNIFIERNPKVLSGKPVIAGTRITVEIILKKMSEGATVEDLLKMYPPYPKIRFTPLWLILLLCFSFEK